jgi:hypothetical protein
VRKLGIDERDARKHVGAAQADFDAVRGRGEDFEVVSYLKKSNPKLYTSLRRAATGRTATTGPRSNKRK